MAIKENLVRTASELERKYNLKQLLGLKNIVNQNTTDVLNVKNNLNTFVIETLKSIENLQDQVDGNITTWFYNGVPTNENEPAINWNTEEEKVNHLGDLYYDQDTGYAYRWALIDENYEWSKIVDSDVTKALALANEAQDTADSKRRVFVKEPTPPYDVGDIWFTSDNDLKRCSLGREKGTEFNSSDWIIATKYTDDSTALAVNESLTKFKAEVETTYETKADFIKEKDALEMRVKENEVLASTKAQVFTSEPTPPYHVGDVYLKEVVENNETQKLIFVCQNERLTGDYVESDFSLQPTYASEAMVRVESDAIKNEVTKSVTEINKKITTEKEVEGYPTTIEDASNNKIERISLKGKSIQTTTPSPDYPQEITSITGIENILNLNIENSTQNGITIVNNHDGSITLNGHTTTGFSLNLSTDAINFKSDKHYSVSFKVLGGFCTNYTDSGNWSILFYPNRLEANRMMIGEYEYMNIARFYGNDTTIIPYLWFGYNATTTEKHAVFNDFTIHFQIEESFIHHIPIPPNEKTLVFRNVGKNLLNYVDMLNPTPKNMTNVINKDGSITTTGKPTINYTLITGSYDITDLLEDGKVYTLSQSTPNNKIYVHITAFNVDGTYEYGYNTMNGNKTFTINKSKYYKYVIRIQTNTVANWGDEELTITNKYMLCKGTDKADTSFEPYKENNMLIDLNLPKLVDNESVKKYEGYDGHYELRSVNDVKDELIIENGNAKIIKRLNKVVFDGSETIVRDVTYDSHYRYTIISANDYKPVKNNVTIPNLISDKFIAIAPNNTWGSATTEKKTGISVSTKNVQGYWFISYESDETDTLDKFKTWLSNNPVEVIYELETPIEIDLGSVEMLETYEGTNNVYVVNNISEATGKLSYLTDSYFNDIYATKASQIIESNKIKLEVEEGLKDAEEKTNAKLELYVEKDDNDQVISMINASADEINLKANRFSLESDKTEIKKDGTVKFEGGTIGGFDIAKDEGLQYEIRPKYDYTVDDLKKCIDLANEGSWTEEELDKYDIDEDGKITLPDYMFLADLFNLNINNSNPAYFKIITPKASLLAQGTKTGYVDSENNLISGFGIMESKFPNATIDDVLTVRPKKAEGTNQSGIVCNGEIYANNGNALNRVMTSNVFKYMDLIETSTNTYIETYTDDDRAFGINIWASDKRLKHDIEDSDYKALDILSKIKHRKFVYNGNEKKVNIGYIADELKELDENMVFEVGKEKIKHPNPNYIIPILSKSIQELKEIVDKQQEEINELKKKNNN